MRRGTFIVTIGLIGTLAGSGFAHKRVASAQCVSETKKDVIGSEVHCFDNGGYDIGYNGEDGVKVACMQDKHVQGACGPDGQVTRLHAYTDWYNKLKQFEANCMTSGGSFAFEDPNFSEPQNDSYCLQAQPEVGTNMFESALCNYRSICPSVAVVCTYSCDGMDRASLDDSEFSYQSANANVPSLRR